MHWNEISNEDNVFLLCINLIFVFSASIADEDTLLDDIYLIKVDSGPCKYIGVLSSLNKELFLKFVLENDFNFWIKNEFSIIGIYSNYNYQRKIIIENARNILCQKYFLYFKSYNIRNNLNLLDITIYDPTSNI